MITEIGSRLRITNPSPDMVDWCKKHLEIPNPEYQKKARMNLWLGDTPRILVMYEVDGDSVIIAWAVSLVWIVSACLIDSDSWIPFIVCVICEIYMMLFSYANDWFGDYPYED